MDYEETLRQLADDLWEKGTYERNIEEGLELNRKGFPRPLDKSDSGHKIPVPYVGGGHPHNSEWARIDYIRATEVANNQLCLICGEPKTDSKFWVYGKALGEPIDIDRFNMARLYIFSAPAPSVTHGHAKCLLLACLYCPHLKGQKFPAMQMDVDSPTGLFVDLSLEDLQQLAHDEKVWEKAQKG